MIRFLLFSLFFVSSIGNLIAQDGPVDAENCRDHPMFNRLPDFYILQCTENFAALAVVTGSEKTEAHEGTLTHIDYMFNSESQRKKPSWLQVTRNYENAVLKAGGKEIFTNNSNASYKLSKDGKEIWVMLTFNSGEDLAVDEFYLDIMEKEPMKQDISASGIFSALNTTGSIALYINFETGKSVIQPESQKIIEDIATMLKDNPSLKISVEGHTQAENAGAAAANKILSEHRAKAVMNALIVKGIAANRLSAKGWGQEKPIGDNKTEEGRAKNRRVEIVKL